VPGPAGPCRIHWINFDCADPYRLAGFWSVVTGYARDGDDRPGDPEAALLPGDRRLPGLLFTRVPEGKTVKNRLHMDLIPTGTTRDEEVAGLVTLGATVVDDRRRPDGGGWVVMHDPEGNEFCVERGDPERDD
jgi:predicted enzyme related to lactoylglutathione lyase